MSKKIAVQESLKEIKQGLVSLGYELVDINEAKNTDAVIYMADGYDVSYLGSFTSMDDGFNMSSDEGTLLINAKGKTVNQIDYIINNRIYSPLFE